ncbi:MAG: hypothetical protein ACRD4P_16765 [Bryobacteraceae bacterium]
MPAKFIFRKVEIACKSEEKFPTACARKNFKKQFAKRDERRNAFCNFENLVLAGQKWMRFLRPKQKPG